jgi:hypothetical protein
MNKHLRYTKYNTLVNDIEVELELDIDLSSYSEEEIFELLDNMNYLDMLYENNKIKQGNLRGSIDTNMNYPIESKFEIYERNKILENNNTFDIHNTILISMIIISIIVFITILTFSISNIHDVLYMLHKKDKNKRKIKKTNVKNIYKKKKDDNTFYVLQVTPSPSVSSSYIQTAQQLQQEPHNKDTIFEINMENVENDDEYESDYTSKTTSLSLSLSLSSSSSSSSLYKRHKTKCVFNDPI